MGVEDKLVLHSQKVGSESSFFLKKISQRLINADLLDMICILVILNKRSFKKKHCVSIFFVTPLALSL